MVDISLTKYAGDLVEIILAEMGTGMENAWHNALESLRCFDEVVGEYGFAQNRDKLVGVITPCGKGARSFVHNISIGQVAAPFKSVLATRSLGAILASDASAHAELEVRISAVQRAYYKRGRIWVSPGVPWKLRRLTLLCDIQGTALSGLEAFCLSDFQCSRLDSSIATVARISMRGKAASRNKEGLVTSSLSNLEVLRHWKIATTSTELCIRMLKWYQKMAACPDDHVLVTAAMFGTTRG